MEQESVFELLHAMDQVTNKLIIQWNRTFNENLGVSHILVLSHLYEHGKSRPSDIAKALGLTPPSLTHLSEKLISKKLAVRLADENDRRILYLEITELGHEMLHRAHKEGQELRKKLFEKLTSEERRQLRVIYEKLNS
ncbi:MarR family winged helix-turn-helix transcriptional regulator [Pseudobacillus badius]|uniref:MarR family winged helix-turn-helix transcriptional regulator n=1 Tax=Bacillus badius TaxID=1455 RepID=UPI0007B09C05|nr:MarR family transcriptional regulator [Bacillus badius]KZO00302.1 MarR family transcriptional regulator [Bacillus badius]MED0668348.1 MarR family transcriptional regulator [Bacillus badius]OCS86468.1 MarR family transcriptional regulator [Bacillus badius]OVE52068.1 MarR family transcriptional regulator [Bacillus badius]TDW03773.1 DNA-binding MarR family transcriptional regulator [Bacillus badius]